jgi:hypothetical protein
MNRGRTPDNVLTSTERSLSKTLHQQSGAVYLSLYYGPTCACESGGKTIVISGVDLSVYWGWTRGLRRPKIHWRRGEEKERHYTWIRCKQLFRSEKKATTPQACNPKEERNKTGVWTKKRKKGESVFHEWKRQGLERRFTNSMTRET